MSDDAAIESPKDHGGFVLFLACAALVAVFLVGVVRTRPPAARDSHAPETEFSAVRARAELTALLGDGAPRPVGSPANRAFVDRLVERLGALGLEPRRERPWFVVPSAHVAARVENVVARIPGSEPGPAVVLLAHHDSVPAGPGAADDAAGVAVLVETARALRAGPPLRRDVVLLVTDGEEAGLVGARAYVREHGVDGVFAVVNVEARGTSGPSLMFETGPGTAGTVSAWARRAPRPVTSSLFAAIYRTMPNDTDLSVFLREDVPGLNFAFTGDVRHYHTPLDTVANLDVRSLQQHGDNALAAVRGLADERSLADSGEIVWFDVLAFGVVRWPESVSLLLAGLGLIGVLAATARSVAAGRARVAGVLAGFLVAAATPAGALALAWGLGELIGANGAVPSPFIAVPEGMPAVAAGASLLAVRLADLLLRRWFSADSAACGAWVLYAAGGVALAVLFPAGCYLLVVPAVVAGVISAVLPPARASIGAFAGLVTGAVLWFPLVGTLADNLGVRPLHVVAVPFALAAPALVPFVMAGGPRRGLVAVAGLALVGVGAIRTIAAEPWTPEQPRAVTVVWSHDTADHHARWFVACEGDLPREMRAAAEFEEEPERVVPWAAERAWAADAPAPDLEAPVLDGLTSVGRDAGRRVRFRLVSRRGAPVTTLVLAPTARVRAISVEGLPVPAESLRREGLASVLLHCRTTPPEGVLIEIDFADQAPVTAYVADRSWRLPEGADALARARPANAAPRQDGDATLVYRRLTF